MRIEIRQRCSTPLRLLAVLAIGLPGAARAQASVGVVVVGEHPAEMARMRGAVSEVLVREGLRPRDVVEVFGGQDLSQPPAESVLDPAVPENLDAARKAYYETQYSQAHERLDRMEALLEATPRQHTAHWLDLHSWRTATYLAQGREIAARKEATRAVRLDPSLRVDQAKFLPAMVELVEAVKKANPPVRVQLVGLPKSAVASIDGRRLKAPFVVTVTRGKHWLTVHAKGHKPLDGEQVWTKSQRFRVPLVPALDLRAERALSALIRDGKAYRDTQGILERAREAGMNALVVGRVGGSQGALTRRLVVVSLAAETIEPRPTTDANPFALEGIVSWAREMVPQAVASEGPFQAVGKVVVEPLHDGDGNWVAAVDAAAVFAYRRRAVEYNDQPQPDGREARVMLQTAGPGARIQARFARRLGARGWLGVTGSVTQYRYLLMSTEMRNLAGNPGVFEVDGGERRVIRAALSYEHVLLASRLLSIEPRLGFVRGVHDSNDIVDQGQPVGAFSSYRWRGLSAGLTGRYQLRRTLLYADVLVVPEWFASADEDPVGTLGDSIAFANEYVVAVGATRSFREHWRLSLQGSVDVFTYGFDGFSESSRLLPAPFETFVRETDLSLAVSVRRRF